MKLKEKEREEGGVVGVTACLQLTRTMARTSQQRQEVTLMGEGKDRDKRLSEHRSVQHPV